MNEKRILILGKYPGGFISSNLVDYFRHKENCLIFYSNNTDLRLRKEVSKLFNTTKPNIVLHAAGVTSGIIDIIERPWIHINDNALINSNVIEMSHKYRVEHFIFMSCCVMYSNQVITNSRIPISEESHIFIDSIEPKYLGVASMKLFTENLCKFYSERFGLKTTCIRHTNTYGPYDHFDRYNSHVFAALLEKVINTPDGGEVSVWGNPSTRKDFLYVKDLCKFIDLIIDTQDSKFQIYNLGGEEVTLSYLVDSMKDVCNKQNIVVKKNMENAPVPFVPIISFLKSKELGFIKKYSLNQGLLETYNWRMWNISNKSRKRKDDAII